MSHLLSLSNYLFFLLSALILKASLLILVFTPTTRVHRPRNGNKLAPNNGSRQNFAIDADKNKIQIEAMAFQSSFRGMRDIYLHFKAEETEVTPLAH